MHPSPPCIYIPIHNSQEEVQIFLNDLPRAEDLLDVLRTEQPPLDIWLALAVRPRPEPPQPSAAGASCRCPLLAGASGLGAPLLPPTWPTHGCALGSSGAAGFGRDCRCTRSG